MMDDVGPDVERENSSMNNESDTSSIILVVEDVNETRDGIEKLLKADGYRVTLARDEKDAIESAQREPPNLILVSVAGLPHEVVTTARQIRELAALGENVPVVVFCIAEIDEGDEVAIGKNVYVTRPDNFNQLRTLLARLLNEIPIAARIRLSFNRQRAPAGPLTTKA
jgi:two-component system, OmpR family, response regulator MprA